MRKAQITEEALNNPRRGRKLREKPASIPGTETASPLSNLQHQIGNRAVQRLLAQRNQDGSGELDDETADRINQQRGGGQPLDSGIQKNMAESTGEDFSQVKVHTDPEADALSQQLGAKAFTTGQDVFFSSGAYQPQASGGQELLVHELTHVMQQNHGAVSGGALMHVNPPGDAFERQADDVAHSVTGEKAPARVQKATEEDEVGQVQMQEEDEDKKLLQMQEDDENEELEF